MGYKRYRGIDFAIEDFNGHVGRKVDGFEGVYRGNEIVEQNLKSRMLLEFCNQKDLYVVNTWFKKRE